MIPNHSIKTILITLTSILALSLTACGSNNPVAENIVLNGTTHDLEQPQATSTAALEPGEEPEYIRQARMVNSDVIGWIAVPNTSIDYPIVLTQDNDFYLDHNLEKETSKSGAIFLDYLNGDLNEQQNIFIYGHNMRNGSMFHDLNSFKKKEFFENAEPITVWLWGEERKYEVFAQSVPSTDLGFRQTSFSSGDEFLEYVQAMEALSKHKNESIEFKPDSEIITLTTCTYEYDEVRCVVQAIRIQ